jgi:hypothetical protein
MKPTDPLYLLSESLDDLDQQLLTLAQKEQLKGRAGYLALMDKDIFLRPFVPDTSDESQKPDAQLLMEAVHLLSLPGGEIVLDYQIGEASKKGIFICAGRKRLEAYYQVLLKFGVYPVQIVPYALIVANYFLFENVLGNKQYLLLDCFKPSWAVLGVFTQYQCVLMRLVHYETLEALKMEIDASILSACANSQVKQCDGFYFYGESQPKAELMKFYQTKPGKEVVAGGSIGLIEAFSMEHPAFPLHLLRHELLSLSGHRKFSFGLMVTLSVVLCAVFSLGALLVLQQGQIYHVQTVLKGL